jgi:sulfur-carrier protein
MTTIKLRLYASLAALLPSGSSGHSCEMEIEEGTSIEQLLDRLNIPASMPKIVFVNGLHAKDNHMVQTGDEIAVFPPIAGG